MPPRQDYRLQRLFIRLPLRAGGRIDLTREQANYLLNVLRLDVGAELLVFNGQDGEWRARIVETGRRQGVLEFVEQTRPQTQSADLHYLFAPLKMARLDYMVQKAVEMGCGMLRPVITRHTQVSRINLERMEANVIEAAEQCEVLSVPTLAAETGLTELIADWRHAQGLRRLIFCDESAPSHSPAQTLADLEGLPVGILVGPEGGFSDAERELLLSQDFVVAISLGPRILRADTAAVAALAVVQATIGDWR